MKKFIYTNGRLYYREGDGGIDEKQAFILFAEHLRELRLHCRLSLVQLAERIDIPNQTLSSYENKTHTPSIMQAMKIASFFHLTVDEFILCGFDEYPYGITELYEKRKNEQ